MRKPQRNRREVANIPATPECVSRPYSRTQSHHRQPCGHHDDAIGDLAGDADLLKAHNDGEVGELQGIGRRNASIVEHAADQEEDREWQHAVSADEEADRQEQLGGAGAEEADALEGEEQEAGSTRRRISFSGFSMNS